MDDLPMFFVFGLPRSGTTWLGTLIAACNPEWMVCHEAHRIDFDMDCVAPFRPWEADAYVSGPRHERIVEYTAKKMGDPHGYGEVTPRLRYFSGAIQRRYPQAKCVHLVRDPRKAVRSMIQFGYYHPSKGRAHRRVSPDRGEWSRVKRTSWAWSFGHNRIRQTCEDFVRLEDLISEWEVMAALAATLGLKMDRGTWEKSRSEKVNPSNPTFEPFAKWPGQAKEEFRLMCEAEARTYGYLTE